MMLYSIVYFNYQNHNDLKPSRGKINNNINKQQTQQSYKMTVKCHRSYEVGTGAHEPKPKSMNTVHKTLQYIYFHYTEQTTGCSAQVHTVLVPSQLFLLRNADIASLH